MSYDPVVLSAVQLMRQADISCVTSIMNSDTDVKYIHGFLPTLDSNYVGLTRESIVALPLNANRPYKATDREPSLISDTEEVAFWENKALLERTGHSAQPSVISEQKNLLEYGPQK